MPKSEYGKKAVSGFVLCSCLYFKEVVGAAHQDSESRWVSHFLRNSYLDTVRDVESENESFRNVKPPALVVLRIRLGQDPTVLRSPPDPKRILLSLSF